MLWFDPALQNQFAWALVHFLWLACIPAGVFAFACRTLPADAAHLRYRCGMATLVVTVILFMVAWQLAGSHASKNRFVRAATDTQQAATIVLPASNLLLVASTNDTAAATSTDIALAAAVDTQKSGNTSSRSLLQASGWATWVTAAYGIGFFLCAMRLVVGYLLGLRMCRGATLVEDDTLKP